MKNINIQKLVYHVKHNYLTLNNVVVAVALVIGAGLAWGSVNAMQRNYALQREVDTKKQALLLAELETETLKFQQRYFESREYQELEARKRLNLAAPGEKVLVLPANSDAAKQADRDETPQPAADIAPSNMAQWMEFLFGGRASRGDG